MIHWPLYTMAPIHSIDPLPADVIQALLSDPLNVGCCEQIRAGSIGSGNLQSTPSATKGPLRGQQSENDEEQKDIVPQLNDVALMDLDPPWLVEV